MKTLKCVLVLFAFVGLLLLGCSDQLQSPVSPTDQSVQAPGSLEKSFPPREFTSDEIPTGVIDPGIFKYPDGKIMLRGHRGPILFTAEFSLSDTGPDLLTGPGEVEINGITDPIAGVGK